MLPLEKRVFYLGFKKSFLFEHFVKSLYHDSIVSSEYPVSATKFFNSFLSSPLLLTLVPIHTHRIVFLFQSVVVVSLLLVASCIFNCLCLT